MDSLWSMSLFCSKETTNRPQNNGWHIICFSAKTLKGGAPTSGNIQAKPYSVYARILYTFQRGVLHFNYLHWMYKSKHCMNIDT